jgi:hypothetical protein
VLARRVAGDLAGERRHAVRVVVKVRYAPFTTFTHGRTLIVPSSDVEAIGQAAFAALDTSPHENQCGCWVFVPSWNGQTGRGTLCLHLKLEVSAEPGVHHDEIVVLPKRFAGARVVHGVRVCVTSRSRFSAQMEVRQLHLTCAITEKRSRRPRACSRAPSENRR